jgi:REP element-mobilizing transposase RayT
MNGTSPVRKPIRLRDFEYSTTGAYSITICAHNRLCRFSKIIEGESVLTEDGKIVNQSWLDIPKFNMQIQIDEFIVMPNHLHGILWIEDEEREGRRPSPTDIPSVIRKFKSFTANQINRLNNSRGEPVWQRNYHDHIIRSEKSLNALREYIVNNPLQWHLDTENPDNLKK